MVVEMLHGFPFEIFSMKPVLREISLVSVQNRFQFCMAVPSEIKKSLNLLYHDKSRNTIFRQKKMSA